MIRAVIDTNVFVSALWTNNPDPDDRVFYCAALAARSAGCLLVTGNARHFPAAPFVVSPAKLAGLL